MIYKISAVFADTESAQSAARRIRAAADDIYEIRMTYITRHGETGSFNNVYYTPPAMSVLPHNVYGNTDIPMNFTEELPTDSTRSASFDYGETCSLTVLTSELWVDEVRQIIHNSSGYDMQITEQDDME